MVVSKQDQTQGGSGWGAGASTSTEAALLRRYPGLQALMKRAKQRIPRFAFDYLEGGVGNEICIERNRQAFDDIEIIPRYGLDTSAPNLTTSLFSCDYAMPLGISPMGLSGLVWPKADEAMAAAAEKSKIPFVLSMVSNTDIEAIARIAPNVVWLQLYAVPQDDYRVTLDMVDRAIKAGVHALVLTLDTPMRQKRLRDLSNGLTVPFRPTLKTVYDVARAPEWALSTLRHGQPRFANFIPYVNGRRRPGDVAGYVDQHMSGAFTWDLIERIRQKWKGPLVLKGIQHPDDAEHALKLNIDGIIISNHGGRQFDAAPAAIDLVQLLKRRVAGRMAIMLDGSIHSGLDILKALVCGADFTFAGRPFLAATAALGAKGPAHLARMFEVELKGVMAQAGATEIMECPTLSYRMDRNKDFSGLNPDQSAKNTGI
ncbi:alpha-hydroxy acid oxidase [Aquamicrobium segne]|uniref:Alpha-hydroxy acid oxidase n=1 Tax=Aquamicrobium segne TaxID=469547 RepID=A0ABW0H4Z1_9HYPH